MATLDFDRGFTALTGHPPLTWQRRLFAEYLLRGRFPSALDLPARLGETAVLTVWSLARKTGAPVPLRLVSVVDRRAVVDQATHEPENIATQSGAPGLRIGILRGQFADNRRRLEDPPSPAIIVGTVEVIGSRLLFEGYEVSRRRRPYHAGLLGMDALAALDQSHLVPPFERLLEQIAQNPDLGTEADRRRILRCHLLPFSATGFPRRSSVFRRAEEDRNDAVVQVQAGCAQRARLPASRRREARRAARQGGCAKGRKKASAFPAPALLLSVCFHEGRYHGMTRDPDAPEWPPLPARLFPALVAGAAQGAALDPSDREALAWLEKQDAPRIAAPHARKGEIFFQYVPKNDRDAVCSHPKSPGKIRVGKRIRPMFFDAEIPLLYAWPFDRAKAPMAKRICAIAERL